MSGDRLPKHPASSNVLLPSLPMAAPLDEVVLFGFDQRAFPFQNHVQSHLIPGRNAQLVLANGPPGSHEEAIFLYGTVLWLDDRFHMWYGTNFGEQRTYIGYGQGLQDCLIAYATSEDGVVWERPELGLVEFNGSRQNNIIDLPYPAIRPPCAVIHEPDDPDPKRRFKMAFEAPAREGGGRPRFCVAYSADGVRWQPSPANPVGPFFEMTGIVKFRGLYYVTGQVDNTAHRPVAARRLCTFVSADFEHWSPVSAVGFDRSPDLIGPSTEADRNTIEEIHLGAALWDRGNVMLGIYGQWHGHFTGDRRLLAMDLGLALTHDAIHYVEPIPGFPFIPAREQPFSPESTIPALIQGQAFANHGDRTLYWYSSWRGPESSGVLMVSWERDRLGMLRPFHPADARAISCPIDVLNGDAEVFVNANGLGPHASIRVDLVDEGFRPLPGYSGPASQAIVDPGLRQLVRWKGNSAIPSEIGRFRLDVHFEGVRPEDIALHAVYVVGRNER